MNKNEVLALLKKILYHSSMMLKLPPSFLFGIAESDLQTVGSSDPQKYEVAQKTMWEVFAEKRKMDSPLSGSFKYSNYKTDIKLLSNTGIKAYRTSISMSRTIDKNGQINKEAILWYRNYLEKIKSKGIQIHLCLYHWEAPQQFSDLGVLDKNFSEYFLKHTKIVLDNFSDIVDYFIPMNELWCIVYLSYFIGIHAPGYQSMDKYFAAYFAMIRLQADVIKKIKLHASKNKISIVNIHTPTYIQDTTKKVNLYVRELADNLTNYIYSDPFFTGSLDDIVLDKFKKYFPKNFKETIKEARLSKEIDYYGLNYYNSQYVKSSRNNLTFEQEIPETAMRNSLGWPVSLSPYYPNGLTDMLVSYTQRYAKFNLKNIIVSENGTPLYTSMDKKVPDDDFRIFFIQEHLNQIQEALIKGAKVNGYFLWTLLDNYEWQEGYKPESAFGIVGVDRETGERVPKKSYYWYQKLMKDFYKL